MKSIGVDAVVYPADSPDAFYTLDSAEDELFQAVEREGDVKLYQVKLLLTIKERELYRQRLNEETGKPFESMEAYLKSIVPRLKAVSGSKVRSLKSWMTRYRIYVLQLDKPEPWLRAMGTHGEILLKAAARHVPTCTLLEEDIVGEHGRKLGRKGFESLVAEIEARLAEVDPDYPESSWTVADTEARVREIVGGSDSRARISIQAHFVGRKIRLDLLTFWVDDAAYHVGDVIDEDHFRRITKGFAVDGLGPEWQQ